MACLLYIKKDMVKKVDAYHAKLAEMQTANASAIPQLPSIVKKAYRAAQEVAATPVISLRLDSLTIKREGQVDWSVEGDTHCGPKPELRDGKIPVKYSVTVTCEPHLDERGFLFDQASVDLWMRRQASKTTKLSCEALVVDTAKEFLLKLARDVPHCKVRELVMTLSPSPFMAGVTCRFV